MNAPFKKEDSEKWKVINHIFSHFENERITFFHILKNERIAFFHILKTNYERIFGKKKSSKVEIVILGIYFMIKICLWRAPWC